MLVPFPSTVRAFKMSHAGDIASTIQFAHINKRPDPKRDIAPETAADRKEAVEIDPDADIDEASDVAEDEMYVA